MELLGDLEGGVEGRLCVGRSRGEGKVVSGGVQRGVCVGGVAVFARTVGFESTILMPIPADNTANAFSGAIRR